MKEPVITLDDWMQQFKKAAWQVYADEIKRQPLTPGEAIGAAGAQAADLGLLRKPSKD